MHILNDVITNSDGNDTFVLYPNPAKNAVYISNDSGQIDKVTIRSIDGRMQTSLNYVLSEEGIDISDLQTGVYFVIVKTKTGKEIVSKIIKQ